MYNISACINTYKRPLLLKKCIQSLLNQKNDNLFKLEIIIVDNDIDKSAMYIIQNEFNSCNIFYLNEPQKNISLARNKAVANSSGEFILFIDDDGYADECLLDTYLNCYKNYQADGIFGTVLPYYDEGVPEWIKKGNFFSRTIQKTGEKTNFTRTTNCFIKASLIKIFEQPFDPKLGLTGGEDVDLFSRLEKNGANFIFCAEAIVYDFVPRERANLSYLQKRTYRTGISYTQRNFINSKHKIYFFINEIIKRILYIIISFALTILFSLKKEKRIYWYLKIISNIGHIAGILGFKYVEYK